MPTGPEPAVAAGWLLGLGVLGQVIPIFLLVRFAPRTGSALGTILTSTELPVAVIASVVLLGDSLGAGQVVGVGLVLSGIALPHLRLPARTARGVAQ
jgi:drug/metabolite transporter (DMT)-like permease